MVAGACMASLSLAVGTALADPPANTFRNLAGTGSDTTQGVMNALGNGITGFPGIQIGGVNQIASYDAVGASPIVTKDPNVNPNCSLSPRPINSGQGVSLLVAQRTAPNHCLQFARSSTDDSGSRSGSHLTYIPFATDAVGYAILQTGSPSRNLSVALLKAIYTCDSTQVNIANFKPLLPASGSGTRKFFLQNILGLTDVPNFTTTNSCVSDIQPGTTSTPLEENSGNRLAADTTANPDAKKQLVPYSISQWIAQTTGNVQDVHGKTLLGNIEGTPSIEINNAATGTRPVYNVVPNVLAADTTSNTNKVFAGGNDASHPERICSHPDVIQKQGFLTRNDCGSTALKTDTGTAPDTKGPGE